jgi:stress response protein YsnF
MSMAAGEYVSVHSQADTEHADLKLERAELKADDKGDTRNSRQSMSSAGSNLRSRNRLPNS